MAKRRGDGEGSIYQDKRGFWRSEISLGYKPDGKAHRKVFYAKTRSEVSSKLKQYLRDQQLGHNIKPEKQTLAHYLRRWLTDTVAPKNRPQTYRSYKWIVETHLVPGLGRVALEKLTPQAVQQFLTERHAAGLSATTVKHIRATLRAALSQAERWGMVHRNVAKLVTPPRAPRYQPRVLTPEESTQLLKALRGHPHEAVYVTALTLGLRRGELLGLRWSDVDLIGAQVSVRGALYAVKKKGLVLSEPKSARAVRKLTLPRVCVLALATWKVQQALDRQWAGSKWIEQDFVFTSKTGRPIHPDTLTKELPGVLSAAKLPSIRLHDLRHSCATTLLAMGVHPKLVQETLGHSTFQLTMDTYSHMLPALRNEVAEKMDEALGRTPTPDTTQQGSTRPN